VGNKNAIRVIKPKNIRPYLAISLIDWQRPSLSGIIINVLVYFTLGLALLSQVNITTLLVRWRIQEITVEPELVKQWARYGLIFLGLITLIAFLLPTGYSLGLLTSAGFVIVFLVKIVLFIFGLLLGLISLALGWFLSFFGVTPTTSSYQRNNLPLLPSSLVDTLQATPPWLEVLRSLIFWLLVVAMVGYLLKSYLEDHPELLKLLKSFKFIGPFISLLIQVWRQLIGWAQAGLDMMILKRAVRNKQEQGAASTGQLWNWLGLRNLAPRERILFYYLNILKRAEKEGVARKKHQTPYEYEPNLRRTVPGVETEVHLLTDTFIHARYSQEEFNEQQVTIVKALWQRIRKALRQK